MRYLLVFLGVMIYNISFTQLVEDFESFITEQDSFLNGSDGSMGFTSPQDLLFLENTFTDSPGGGFWSGWAISSTTDVVTPGFLNQYSVISGSGFDQSNNYAVAYIDTKIDLLNEAEQADGYGFYVNNSTYAFLSMRDGDAFAKKFGGATGDDPDFFYLSIKKYPQGIVADSTIFYLADFRSVDNSDDYIISEWTYVDLSAYSDADYFTIDFHSSDTGNFGINTPTYFCIDNFTFDGLSSTDKLAEENSIQVYPNPASEYLNIEGFKIGDNYEVFNSNAQLIMAGQLNEARLDLSQLDAAVYFVSVLSGDKRYTKRFVKQ